MFKHILVATDGSPSSEHAAKLAVGLARTHGAKLTAVYVVDPYPFTGVGADFAYGQTQYLSAAMAEANATLDDVKRIMDEEGMPVSTVVGEGHSVHEGILRVMESSGADLIVMGSHGKRGLEKLMLGSVTQRVLSAVKIPVLVVRC